MHTTAAFTASSSPVRASVGALAAFITLAVLAAVGQQADRQYDHALLAQTAANATLLAQQAAAAARV